MLTSFREVSFHGSDLTWLACAQTKRCGVTQWKSDLPACNTYLVCVKVFPTFQRHILVSCAFLPHMYTSCCRPFQKRVSVSCASKKRPVLCILYAVSRHFLFAGVLHVVLAGALLYPPLPPITTPAPMRTPKPLTNYFNVDFVGSLFTEYI